MKKVLAVLLKLILLIPVTIVFAEEFEAENNIKVFLDDTQIVFDVSPRIVNDRTMVPLRAIFEALGATVEWDNATQTITAYNSQYKIRARIGEYDLDINNISIKMDTTPIVINGRTLVPVRFISSAFNCDVNWIEQSQTVIIYSNYSPDRISDSLVLETGMYNGEVLNSKPDGYGCVKFNNGNYYEGFCKDGKQSGYGVFKLANGDIYQGEFAGLPNGYGTYTYASGAVYRGNWSNGKKDGYVEYYYTNGDVFKGNFVNDFRIGYGEFYWHIVQIYKGNY